MAVAGTAYIDKEYLDMREYPHTCENNIIVELYEYNAWNVIFSEDISDKVIDYSYECDCSNNVRQTASITLKVETNDRTWYMRRENKMHEWAEDGSVYSITWMHVLYKLTKVYLYPDGTKDTMSLGFFIPVSDDYTYDSTTGTISISLQGLSAALTKEYGGNVLTYREGKILPPDKDNPNYREIVFPTALAIPANTAVDGDLFRYVVMGSNDTNIPNVPLLNVSVPVPIDDAFIDYGANGQKAHYLPCDLEFDVNVGRMDIIEEILETCFYNGNCWIDEERWFWAAAKCQLRIAPEALWRAYGNLFQGESDSYNDSGLYNVTEVFGKNNEYYAICDESYLDGGQYIRKQVLHCDELQSNEECQERANWENYHARYGRQSLTVTLKDRYIKEFKNPSRRVGHLIEYRSVDGDINLYNLNKLSYSGNTITMELSLFKPLYKTAYIREQMTLSKPYVFKHEVINNNTLRLYVSGEDILHAAVKAVNKSVLYSNTYIGIEDTVINGENCKIVDIPINHNGIYKFQISLYSPFYEDSPVAGVFTDDGCTIEVTELVVPAITEDNDIYPHPNIFEPEPEHKPYLVTQRNQIITTENGTKITI